LLHEVALAGIHSRARRFGCPNECNYKTYKEGYQAQCAYFVSSCHLTNIPILAFPAKFFHGAVSALKLNWTVPIVRVEVGPYFDPLLLRQIDLALL